MDEIKKHSGCNRRIVLQGTILFFITIYTCLTLYGCTANNTDMPGSGNNNEGVVSSNGSDGTSASDSGEKGNLTSEGDLPDKDDLSTKDSSPRDKPSPEDKPFLKDKFATGDNLSSEGKNDLLPDTKNEDLRNAGKNLPLEESMVIVLSVESEYMGRKMPCRVYLPKGYGGGEAYPVWYGLHGYSSNESMWIDQVGVTAASDELIDDGVIKPMIMVFPYTKDATMKEISKDLEDDGKFSERNMDRFICEELVPYMDSRYDAAASADSRYIGGFSMGGMIALRIAFHHPDLFSKVGGYSAAVISSDYSGRQLEEWLFPYDNVNDITDIVEFDKQKGLDRLSVYLNCGTNNDPFLPGLQSLYKALQIRGIPTEFNMYKGGHDLEHAKANIKEYLMFYVGKH